MYIKIIKIDLKKFNENIIIYKKKYYENKIKNNNIKNTWRTLNKVIGNKKNQELLLIIN